MGPEFHEIYYYLDTYSEPPIENGDRVYCIVNHPDNNKDIVVGSTGTVAAIDPSVYRPIGVEWDEAIEGGHDLWGSGKCEDGHGWWVFPKELMLQPPECMEFETAGVDEICSMLGMK